MKQIFKICICLCFLANVVLSIGQTNIPQNIEIVLSKAEKNREELKRVILHYQKLKDNQKLQAAYFLIANMEDHYSEDYIWTDETGKNLNFDELKYPNMESSLKAFNQLKSKTKIQGKIITYNDIDRISSGLLIRNIDLAFEVWQKPGNKNLSFEDFCEYILPYRVCTEPLQDWRQTFYNRFDPFVYQLKNGGKNYELCDLINENMNTWFVETYGLEKRQEKFPLLGPLNLLHRRQGKCPDIANLTAYAMRSVGVPCCVDFTPYWATSSGGHYWNVTWDEKNKKEIFTGASQAPGTYQIIREIGKAYRYTYAKQKNSLAVIANKDEIPAGFLQSPYIKDVTQEYMKTANVEINISSQKVQDKRFAFVGVFNYLNWMILDWTKIIRNNDVCKIDFKKLGIGCVYLPMIKEGEENIPLDYPFSIDRTGKVTVYKPDLTKQRKITLNQQDGYLIYRNGKKYALYYWDNKWIKIGIRISSGNQYLKFENVPSNALLVLLPEYTQKKERIFTIDEKGHRFWW